MLPKLFLSREALVEGLITLYMQRATDLLSALRSYDEVADKLLQEELGGPLAGTLERMIKQTQEGVQRRKRYQERTEDLIEDLEKKIQTAGKLVRHLQRCEFETAAEQLRQQAIDLRAEAEQKQLDSAGIEEAKRHYAIPQMLAEADVLDIWAKMLIEGSPPW